MKKIRGGHLPKDTRAEIFRESTAPVKRTPRTASAAVGDQAQWDTMKAEVKKSGVKSAERAAAQAVAAILGIDNPEGSDSEAEEGWQRSPSIDLTGYDVGPGPQDPMTAGNATAAVGSGFESTVHWREMQASVASLKKEATETKEWRKTKDKSDEGRDAKVSALAGELATLAANEKTHFDRLESMLGQVLQNNQSTPRPPFTPNPNGRCRKCKVKGHGYPDCKSTDEEAAVLYAHWEGNKQRRTNTPLHKPATTANDAHTPQNTASLNTAAPPCMHMSQPILSAAMALIACCTQPITLEQQSEREPGMRGSDTDRLEPHENGTGTTLQWRTSISSEPMSGSNWNTKQDSERRNEPQHHRNKAEINHTIGESIGNGEERVGILSTATTGCQTPPRTESKLA